MQDTKLRNVAIIAHVDHGKTTLVDEMLKQGGIYRENQATVERVMDSNDLERERGITILAKNTAVHYKDVKINIVDTPGHADFGGEVERILKMVNGVILLVDAAEGPMPQTRFVLSKALELGHKVIVVVNKVDRPDQRIHEVMDEVLELLLDLNATDEQFESPTLFCSGRQGTASYSPDVPGTDLVPLFETILNYIPAPEADTEAPFQMLVSSIDYNEFVGRIAIGRIERGTVKQNQEIAVCNFHQPDAAPQKAKATALYQFDGLGRVPVTEATAGNIIAQGGKFKDVTIQGTIRSAFVQNDPSIWIVVGGGTTSDVQTDPVHYDNVVCTQTGGWNENINLQWTLENSGRRICLVNYRWGSTISTGVMSITAPSGKYFFEDGISKTTLKFSREVIEMIGYGDDKTFFGWIVLNRRDLMTTSRYGKFQQILVTGIVTGTTSSASVRFLCFDGSKSVSVSRLGKGMYRIYLPSTWGLSSRYLVMATGIYSTAENTPIYPTVKAIYSYYFDIYTQDDASRNDGSFNFQVISTADWDL